MLTHNNYGNIVNYNNNKIMSKSWYNKTVQGLALNAKKDFIYKTASVYGIKEIVVFGSVAKGSASKDSDIDLYVDIDLNKFHPDDLYKLAQSLKEKIGFDFDISCSLTINSAILNEINRDGKVL
jgi:predicted nucleotidyltransferase